jgi:hypothetical protein
LPQQGLRSKPGAVGFPTMPLPGAVEEIIVDLELGKEISFLQSAMQGNSQDYLHED